jgi:hypothetical protein
VAMPRKGSRLITVGGVEYRWLVRHKPTYAQGTCQSPLTVAVELATHPGAVAVLVLPHAHPCNWMAAPTAPVQPATVAHGIRKALGGGWDPGQPGSQHRVTLDSAED